MSRIRHTVLLSGPRSRLTAALILGLLALVPLYFCVFPRDRDKTGSEREAGTLVVLSARTAREALARTRGILELGRADLARASADRKAEISVLKRMSDLLPEGAALGILGGDEILTPGARPWMEIADAQGGLSGHGKELFWQLARAKNGGALLCGAMRLPGSEAAPRSVAAVLDLRLFLNQSRLSGGQGPPHFREFWLQYDKGKWDIWPGGNPAIASAAKAAFREQLFAAKADHAVVARERNAGWLAGAPVEIDPAGHAASFLLVLAAPSPWTGGQGSRTIPLILAALLLLAGAGFMAGLAGAALTGKRVEEALRREGETAGAYIPPPARWSAPFHLPPGLRDAIDSIHARGERLSLFERAVVNSAETILITDSNERILYVNPAFERISGYSPHEVIGKTPRMLQSGRHSKQFYADMWKTLGRGESWTGFFINRRKDGSLYEEEAVISPVCGGEGSVVGYVAIKRDVTREREMIRKLEKGHRLEAIGRLAGGIAHDFNNLLVAVLGSVELLQKRLPSGVEYQKDLGVIHGAAVRASQLTRQLLAFARHQVLKPVHMDLDRVVADMMPLIQRLIPETIEAAHRNEGPTAWVRADRTQVEQVILNLCVNSRDAMPDGGKLLLETRKVRLDGAYVSDHPWARQGDFVVLSVSDTGLGMNRETQDHIFEPFFTTKKDGRGTGLGLAAVYGIVQQHEGLIHAYSEPGEGTTFKVYLPAVAGPAAPERESIAAPARGGTEVILVVEDEPAVRDVVVDVLLSYGYRILEAENGAAAMEILEDADAEIDLVASDLVMPVMGGVELLKEARRIRPDLPFLFSSGYSESAVRHEFDDEPRVAFLAKPFGVDVLLRTIRRLLDRAGSPSNP